jgi:hypothetical protein
LIGQDGGQTIPVGEKALFVFSDTLLACQAEVRSRSAPPPAFAEFIRGGGVFLANTAGLAPRRDLDAGWGEIAYYCDEQGLPKEILPALDRERLQGIRFWPEHGIDLDGRVYLYYLGVQTTDPTTIWGFRTAGAGLAALDPLTGECSRVWRDDDWRLWRVLDEDLHFGVQVLREGDYIYVFGSVRRGLLSSAIVARVAPPQIGDPDQYEFLCAEAPEWSAARERALDLGPCGAEYSVSFNAHLGCYLMCYADEYAKALTLRTAPKPWGPYSDPYPVTGLPHDPSSEMVYLGFEHAEFSRENGRIILVSYCQPRFTRNSIVVVQFR